MAALALLAGAAWTIDRLGDGEDVVRVVDVPTPPAPVTVVRDLRSGETLADVFGEHGLDPSQILRVVDAMREFESPRRIRAGTEVHFAMRPEEAPFRISLRLDRDRTLHVFSSPEETGAWQARLDSVAIRNDTIVVAGLVETHLYDASLGGDAENLGYGEIHQIAFQLSQIFGWEIDFTRDLRTHDAFRVLVAREVRPDGSVRSASMLAAEFRNDGRELTAVRFKPEEDGPEEYYDEEGEALRGQFLLAPLDLARVTSGFNMNRFHPILKRRRPHLGVDYGAGRGTPVRATGSGRVSRAGPWGGYGTAIEIRHANALRTRYAHLSGIARGVRAGGRVEQGQIIGYVGSSGLATAAHLHYEFLQNGRQVNPARMNFPKADPIPDELREVFMDVSAMAFARLRSVPLPVGAAATGRHTQD